MDIVLHGTKGGRKIFTPQKISGLLDVTADGAKSTAMGQQAYGIRFTANNTIFSKYKIIRDVRGDKRTGFVGISLSLSNKEKLSGTDISAVLDMVSEKYCQQYIVDNNLNEVTEDWAFLDNISSEYNTKLLNVSDYDAEIMQSGDKDDAFVYFKDTAELQKYFNAPYQEEYTPYRQILFVSSDLQGKQENPLEAIRNSGVDLTEKIDLENPKYTLLFNPSAKGGVSINVKANGSTRFCKNKIRRKNDLEIIWKKDYYQTVTQGGKWNEISSDFINVDDNAQTVTVEEIELQPETKEIIFDVVSEKDGVKVTDAEIKVDTQPWQSLSNITFTAEELGQEHKIAARKGEYLFSDVVRITPKNYSAVSILLPLIEKRVVKITAADQENGDAIWPFKVRITGKEFYKVTDQIEFVGNEIDKEWNIQIEKRREYSESEKIKFCPATDGNEIIFKLKKEKKQTIGPFNPGDSDPNSPNKEKKQKSFAAKAFFSKPAVIASMIVVVLIITLGIWDFYDAWDNQTQSTKTPLTAQQITAYVDGNSLSLDTLNEFKVIWEKQKPKIITHSSIAWYNPTTWFVGSNEAKSDSTDYKKWNESSQLIETQIAGIINEILKPKEPTKEEQPQVTKKEEKKPEYKKKTSVKPEKAKGQPTPQERKTAAPHSQQDVSTTKTSEIIEQYIRSGKLDEAKLEDYKNTEGINQDLKDCIVLCLKLWSLNGDKNNSYSWMQKQITNESQYSTLKVSALKSFVDKMCDNKTPKYWYQIPGNKTIDKTLNNIKCQQ